MYVAEKEIKRRRFRQRDKQNTLKAQRVKTDDRKSGHGVWGWQPRWIDRNAPHVEEWGDLDMWVDGMLIELDDDDMADFEYDYIALMESFEAEWDNMEVKFGIFGSIATVDQVPVGMAVAEYEPLYDNNDLYLVEDHDLDYDDTDYYEYDYDYNPHWYEDEEADRRNAEEAKKWDIEDAWDEHRPPSWIVADQIDTAYDDNIDRRHPLNDSELAESEAEPDIMLYMLYGEAGLQEDEEYTWQNMLRQHEAWNRNSPFYGLHPKPNR